VFFLPFAQGKWEPGIGRRPEAESVTKNVTKFTARIGLAGGERGMNRAWQRPLAQAVFFNRAWRKRMTLSSVPLFRLDPLAGGLTGDGRVMERISNWLLLP